ncbi:MAG: UDP-glucose 4-epimerase GalE, partial [Gammaproteobacteria bacterium]|nr:UDP-glucose 4-epimerase GalE [Gammaproteobacteria bacterium]
FSSSATVYGAFQAMPVNEDSVCAPITAYGRTKFHVEQMLSDLQASDPAWGIVSLRYFNPVGAHESGLIGERPLGTPANLVPYLAQVAAGERSALKIYGRDYETRDGTGVRDYVHVVDLAKGHVAALQHLARSRGHLVVNLGTGRGTSVLEMVNAFERASNKKIACEFTDRRSGDVDVCVADVSRARDLLGWSAEHDVDRMCIDAWRWQSMIDA